MNISIQLLVWGVGIIFLGGIAYGDIRNRVRKIEDVIGNGRPGVFARRDYIDSLKETSWNRHNSHEERLTRLERLHEHQR